MRRSKTRATTKRYDFQQDIFPGSHVVKLKMTDHTDEISRQNPRIDDFIDKTTDRDDDDARVDSREFPMRKNRGQRESMRENTLW